ncbi:cytochrome b [Rickettsiales endosymbiont of Stachyamoeba lipophora]|uniref:cytochrome b n=1 Tax=Rickettsiales endosymbiont of Stachyamoeba lipophora TaxID=2486578 RepID=UPI000F64FA33|nr:cytochrome b/b6 domain-containing protein [Rickettsiales endosymbiont of Stachyamoeba lipophora]AZL16306.1 cytochrome b [Rickettsiales endosymbiont of Stachyamoeba lipophora]
MQKKYHFSLRILHWFIALLVLGMLTSGIIMTELEGSDLKWQLYSTHKSIGILILILFIFRLAARLLSYVPELPGSIPFLQRQLAKIVHFLLYVLTLIVPLSGYMMSNSFGYKVSMFGIQMPDLINKNLALGKIFSKMHALLPYILLVILLLHIVAVIKHLLHNKENLIKRIV